MSFFMAWHKDFFADSTCMFCCNTVKCNTIDLKSKMIMENLSDCELTTATPRLIWASYGVYAVNILTHWGRVMYVCVSRLTIISTDNDLSPGRRQAIILTNTGVLLFGPLGTNFIEILIDIRTFPFKKMLLICRLENGGHFVLASMC